MRAEKSKGRFCESEKLVKFISSVDFDLLFDYTVIAADGQLKALLKSRRDSDKTAKSAERAVLNSQTYRAKFTAVLEMFHSTKNRLPLFLFSGCTADGSRESADFSILKREIHKETGITANGSKDRKKIIFEKETFYAPNDFFNCFLGGDLSAALCADD